MDRELREPPTQATFDAITIPAPAPAFTLPTVRLGDRGYRSHFYENPRSRLTPKDCRCVYLTANAVTAVLERWGDAFSAHRKTGAFTISRRTTAKQVFLNATLPELKLCDLTHADVISAVGVDIATLHYPYIRRAKTWAERIARHPAQFDGILYRSRHTQDPCLVLWLRPGGRDLEREISFAETGAFNDSTEAYSAAAKCHVLLSFAR